MEAESPCYISLPRIGEEEALESPRERLCVAYMGNSRGWQDGLCTETRLPLLPGKNSVSQTKEKINFMTK